MFFKKPEFTLKDNLISDKLDKSTISAFNKLKQSSISLKKDEITLFYPGCGNDIIRPLFLLYSLSDFKKANIILSDNLLSPSIIADTVSDLTGIKKFKQSADSHIFRFKDKEIRIIYKEGDSLSDKDLLNFDIFFERAFQLFRKDSIEFIPKIINKLNKGGLFISDFVDFKNKDLKELKFPKEISKIGFYKNFGILRKS